MDITYITQTLLIILLAYSDSSHHSFHWKSSQKSCLNTHILLIILLTDSHKPLYINIYMFALSQSDCDFSMHTHSWTTSLKGTSHEVRFSHILNMWEHVLIQEDMFGYIGIYSCTHVVFGDNAVGCSCGFWCCCCCCWSKFSKVS